MFFWICQNVKKNKQKRYVFQMGKIWLIIQVNVHYILSYGHYILIWAYFSFSGPKFLVRWALFLLNCYNSLQCSKYFVSYIHSSLGHVLNCVCVI